MKLLLFFCASMTWALGLAGTVPFQCFEYLDVVATIDGSDSIPPPQFEVLKESVLEFAETFLSDASQRMFGVVVYSSKISDTIRPSRDLANLSTPIMDIVRPADGTATHLGISAMTDMLLSMDGREHVPKVGVVITDGMSKNQTATAMAAESAREQGINMFAVGVGHLIDNSELNAIASSPDNVVTFDTFEDLHSAMSGFVREVCKVDGRWGSWEKVSESECSVSCGGGEKTIVQVRECDNPPPSNGGRDCRGNGTKITTRSCNEHTCPVDCASNPCRNGDCIDDEANTYLCQCYLGYTGRNCEIPDCSSNPCANGTCEIEGNDYHCDCLPGYTGRHCETEINECDSAPCQNGATCVDLVGSCSCTCPPGYTGRWCETEINECDSAPCRNGATCVDLVGSFSCTCLSGYTGRWCELDIDECATNSYSCGDNSRCINTPGGYECECNAGYTWDGESCTGSYNPCSAADCEYDNGVAYFPHPTNRRLFYQCREGFDNYIIQSCSSGTVWSQFLLVCNHPNPGEDTPPSECDGLPDGLRDGFLPFTGQPTRYIQCVNGVATYEHCPPGSFWTTESPPCTQPTETVDEECRFTAIDESPTRYLEIHNGEFVRDCAPGTVFNQDSCGCVHPSATATESQCPGNATPLDGDGSQYEILVHGSWIPRQCPPGTVFVLSACKCDFSAVPVVQECKPEVKLEFNNGASDTSGKWTWVQRRGVRIAFGYASFRGDSFLRMNRFSNMDFGRTLSIRFFIRRGDGEQSYPQAVVTNADCGRAGAIYIILNANDMTFAVLNKGGTATTVVIPYPSSDMGWTRVSLVISQGVMRAGVSGVYRGSPFTGEVKRVHCAIQVGQGTRLNYFQGDLDDFEISMCHTSLVTPN